VKLGVTNRARVQQFLGLADLFRKSTCPATRRTGVLGMHHHSAGCGAHFLRGAYAAFLLPNLLFELRPA
jgi:hypothetical protein